jgi:hypothetical protein
MVLFCHIHKSGGTTLKWIMRNSFGLRHLEVDPLNPEAAFPDTAVYHANGVIDRAKSSLKPIDVQGLAQITKSFPHVVSLQSHNLSPAQDLGNHRWFTYLRDPRKQVASWFQYLVEIGKRTDLEFFSYMQNEFVHERQCKMLSGQPDFASAAQVIRDRNVFCGFVEDFDRSLLLLKHLQIPELRPTYIARGIARKRSIAQDLLADPEALRVIDAATVEDRQLYDYVRTELYPAYIEAYGGTLDLDLAALKEREGSFNKLRLNLSRLQSRLVYERLWMPRKRRHFVASEVR